MCDIGVVSILMLAHAENGSSGERDREQRKSLSGESRSNKRCALDDEGNYDDAETRAKPPTTKTIHCHLNSLCGAMKYNENTCSERSSPQVPIIVRLYPSQA